MVSLLFDRCGWTAGFVVPTRAVLRGGGARLTCRSSRRPRSTCGRRGRPPPRCCEAHDERLLVEAPWLAQRLDDVTVLDVRGEVRKLYAHEDDDGSSVFQEVEYRALQDAYLDAHVPNAVFVDWTADIVDGGGLYNLKSREDFIQQMEEKGVNEKQTVVVYDRGDMLFATRLWHALTLHGHPDVRVLNGGFAGWEARRMPVSTEVGCVLSRYSTFQPADSRRALQVSADDILSRRRATDILLDARSRAQFTGAERRSRLGGHIPGARNVPHGELVRDEGGFRPLSQLRRAFERAGVDVAARERRYVSYCNGGVASTAVIFALRLLGVPPENTANYDGSWNEWGNRDDVPVERGEAS